MKYTVKTKAAAPYVVADDMILTKDLPTQAGSRMLSGYQSLFEAEVLTRLQAAGYALGGKADVGEFAIDLVGETSANGPEVQDGCLVNPAAAILLEGEAKAALVMDVNGSPRRAAAQTGLTCVKPTYGTVSRFGTIPTACSGETVSVMACCPKCCKDILDVVSAYDPKDGTSLPDSMRRGLKEAKAVKKVAYVTSLCQGADTEVLAALDGAAAKLAAAGVEVVKVENEILPVSRVAWNILMSAELCNNVSRYDGVKYGYRAKEFTNIDELYTNSRTEAFGDLLKTAILFGSETLSTQNYQKVYDKALRIRRVVMETMEGLFAGYDALLLPACSCMRYPAAMAEEQAPSYQENFYTAPASLTGLPAVVAAGVQLVGPAFSEYALLDCAALLGKEDK